MFTGLIETLGTVRSVSRESESALIGVAADKTPCQVAPGDSVAINGVCLTLEKAAGGTLFFRAVAETLARSTLGALASGDRVNLERALRPSDRLGGHFVLGHVDGIGRIADDAREGDSLVRTFESDKSVARYLAFKGSVAIDGISLTVARIEGTRFSVSFIPYSLRHTTMGFKKSGDAVNIEVDVLARYTARILEGGMPADSGEPIEGIHRNSLYDTMERLGF